MRIGVVSDTHMPSRAKRLPEALVRGLQGVELILHAGDFTSPEVIVELETIAPIEGVAGNNDGEEIVSRFGRKKVLTYKGFRIGLVHGDGKSKTTERRAQDAFTEDEVDIIVFGHSHTPLMREVEGVLLFNPGSPTDKRRQPQFSYGILELGTEIKAEHYFYDSKL
ncbi:phosphodiesterase [Aneurinibacillus migulanus]|uniref:metallophosphoesterase family protein n=1 Tax=Aneurinibacillus migulanus TaxID=47500 RepID=UPI0005BCE91D|nr:metallophosphoesterase [Aneurinibacillus migulanus]KIV56022.1 phosphodiesterase [Aneurinibacillus migulanus]KPD06544.1 phosphodiesterase [Aneurinibacillus migulanus]CEH29349.1 Phosphodiesterase family protein [Aneurinibacillus migulanus]